MKSRWFGSALHPDLKTRISVFSINFLVIGLAVGCVSNYQAAPPATFEREISEARKLKAEGHYKAAAELYRAVAQRSQSPAADQYAYLAMQSYFQAGEFKEAEDLGKTIQPANLSQVEQLRFRLLYGRIYLAQQKAEQALQQLDRLPAEQIGPQLQLDLHSQRAQAFSMLGNHLESAREQIMAEELIDDPEVVKLSQDRILSELAFLSDASLMQLKSPRKDVLSGWMELAEIRRKADPGTPEFERLIADWRLDYPDHPARIDDWKSDAQGPLQPMGRPQAIGVILPLSGPFAQAGEAIRQGILIAQRYDPAPPIPIRFYNSDLADPAELYQQLTEDGADFIIGPLEKDMMKTLSDLGQQSLPILALNQVPELAAANLYQFGLNPEDEVDQAAESAWFDGYQRALVFVPDTSHGQRVAEYFTQKWKELGGKISATGTYDPQNTEGYDESIRNILEKIGYRRGESGRLEEGIGSRRYNDIVFLHALPAHARLIKPIFQYHDAGRLPVYSTSQIYSGYENPFEDRDLTGIVFCDIPWLFHLEIENTPRLESVLASWSHPATSYVRLMALGFDAYDLIPHLSELVADPDQSFAGVTGNLSIREGGRIHRQLVCADFENGIPVPRGPQSNNEESRIDQ